MPKALHRYLLFFCQMFRFARHDTHLDKFQKIVILSIAKELAIILPFQEPKQDSRLVFYVSYVLMWYACILCVFASLVFSASLPSLSASDAILKFKP